MRKEKKLESNLYPREICELYYNYPYNVILNAYKCRRPFHKSPAEVLDDKIIEYLNESTAWGISRAIEERLNTKQQLVLNLRYRDNKSLAETADEMNLSTERIRQIEGKAFRILLHPNSQKIWRAVSWGEYLEVKGKYEYLFSAYTKGQDFEEVFDVNSLCAYEFTVRTFNCLCKSGLVDWNHDFIGDLPKITLGELFGIRNLGISCAFEIYTKLKEKAGIDLAKNDIYLDENGEPYFTPPRFRIFRYSIKTKEEAIKCVNEIAAKKGWTPIEF